MAEPQLRKRVSRHPGLHWERLTSGESRFRIHFFRHGRMVQQSFHYQDAASRQEAFAQAQRVWRELRGTTLFPAGHRRRPAFDSSGSGSGLVGVRRTVSSSKGREYCFWAATWTDASGRRHSRKFSIAKYGPEEARRLAIEARKAGVSG